MNFNCELLSLALFTQDKLYLGTSCDTPLCFMWYILTGSMVTIHGYDNLFSTPYCADMYPA